MSPFQDQSQDMFAFTKGPLAITVYDNFLRSTVSVKVAIVFYCRDNYQYIPLTKNKYKVIGI